MKNMPSVMKEMPIAAAPPAAGKWMQHERLLPVADGGSDFSASATNANSPETFHRLLQKNLHGQDRGSASEPSAGSDRQVGDSDIIKSQMARTGTEAQATAGEEVLDRARLTKMPEVRGTAKKKMSKEHYSVGVANFIISSGNTAPVNESGDPSPEASAEGQRRSVGRPGVGEKLKITAATVAPSPLKTGFGKCASQTAAADEVLSIEPSDLGAAPTDTAPMVAGSGMLHSRGGRRDASGKAEEPVRLSTRDAGKAVSVKEASLSETGAGSGGSVVTDGTGASGNSVPPADLGDSILTALSGKTRQAGGDRGVTAGAAHSPFGTGFGEHTQGMATTEKVSPTALGTQPGDAVSIALASDAAEETLLDRSGAGKAVASIEMGVADGSTHAVRRAKGAPLPNAFATQAVDATLQMGSDVAEEILSPGAQDASGKTGKPIRSNHRHVGKEATFAGTEAGPGGRIATAEASGSGKIEATGGFGDPTRAGRGGESRQDNGTGGVAAGIVPPPLRTDSAQRVQPAIASEKVAPPPGAFAAALVDAIAPGSNTGEEILAAGRQTVLMTQVIEAAQPLVQRGGGRILISLNPPSLGALDIDVRVKRDNVELFVVANNQDVQQTLCSHVEQLRKALVDQGLNMDRFQVVVGDRSADQQGRDPRQEGMSGRQWEARDDQRYHLEEDGEDAGDGMRKAVRSDGYPSVGGINVFI